MKSLGIAVFCLFGLFWLGIVLALDVKLFSDIVRQVQSRRFPSTYGQMTHSEVTTHRGSKGGTQYGIKIRYRFTVNDQQFLATRYRYNNGMSSSSSRWAHAIVAAHPVGAPVIVFYNPSIPGDALLFPGIDGEDLLAALFLTPFNLIGLWICWGPVALTRERLFPRVAGGVKIIRDPPRLCIRLPGTSPWVALPVVFGLCFLCVIMVGLVFDGHPSLTMMFWVWTLVLGAGAGVFVWRWNRIRSGAEDLLIDEASGRITLPMTCGRKAPVMISLSDVQAITVEKILRQRSKGRSVFWFAPALHLREHTSEFAPLVRWNSETRAQAFATWLREQLRV